MARCLAFAWFDPFGDEPRARHFGGGGGPTAPPPTAAPPPSKTDAEIAAEAAKTRAANRNRRGRAATILGGELTTPAGDSAPGTKTTLG